MDFEWDPAKAATNRTKHGIDFPAASRVFDDPRVLVQIDPRNYGGETRLRAIGRVEDQVILVCYTMRGEIRRIISARRANRRERNAYSL
ncbi:MAG TPA: BrnT family toxin [Stellaceae bacterium]